MCLWRFKKCDKIPKAKENKYVNSGWIIVTFDDDSKNNYMNDYREMIGIR